MEKIPIKITFGVMLVITTSPLFASPFGEAVKCYHCYESFTETRSFEDSDGASFGEKFVRCDKNKLKWNSWDCPVDWPVCVIMKGKVGNHSEIIRSCAQRDFCARYSPPAGVTVDSCRECDTTLCNDYVSLPPSESPLFTFNININLNLKKTPQNH